MPRIIPYFRKTIGIYQRRIKLTLSWGEPFNNLDPIVNYTVSCSGDVMCPPNFTTTDNTSRSYTITNLTPMTNYTFSVVATNSIGSGEAGVVMITTPGKIMNRMCIYTFTELRKQFSTYICTYIYVDNYHQLIHFNRAFIISIFKIMRLLNVCMANIQILYTYKFLKDVNFAVFVGNLPSTKFKSSKFYKTVIIHLKHKV